MRSMTAYGSGEYLDQNISISVEIKSYNNRFLEINHLMPAVLSSLEGTVDSVIKTHAQRGHVDVIVRIKNFHSKAEVCLDKGLLDAYMKAIAEAEKEQGRTIMVDFGSLNAIEGLFTPIIDESAEIYREGLLSAMDKALVHFDEAKDREGLVTRNNLRDLNSSLLHSLDTVVANAQSLDAAIKDSLKARFDQMLGEEGYDESRFLQEVAVMLVKYSINEEIVRLGEHAHQLDKLLDSPDPIGKRLDFLTQEMNREINTIGSKSMMAEVTNAVVVMKDCLENIREQMRNIE
jgi:uncharacterized protein (TIGR00255 family)